MESGNRMSVDAAQFTAWYRAPLDGDLAVIGDVGELIGSAPMRTDVTDDYCGATRPSGALTMGALEHSVPVCDTTRPPMATPVDPGGGDGTPGGDAGNGDNPAGGDGGGCCQAPGRPDALPVLLVVLVLLRRRRAV
jgi:hypothetical protein